jgi:hypothetical protein
MGSDDLHHKRKHRSIESLKRQKGNRAQYDYARIVCEDSKTEPYYFRGLCNSLGLNPANIKISGCPNGNDPFSLVNYAQEIFEQEPDHDRIYCVFDKENSNYQGALNKIQELFSKGVPIYAVPSVPCFEYWLLLHFEESTSPYAIKNGKTPGEQLKSKLKKHIDSYFPCDKEIYEKTKKHTDIAISRAKRINKLQSEYGADNPSTKVYELVEYLRKIKN